jgi:hypothetical protein
MKTTQYSPYETTVIALVSRCRIHDHSNLQPFWQWKPCATINVFEFERIIVGSVASSHAGNETAYKDIDSC